MVMVAGPGVWAGMSVCQASLLLSGVSGWPSMLAVSRVGVVVVSGLAGWPGRPCPSRLHWWRPSCLLMAVILPSARTACVYGWFPLSARMGVSPGFHAQTWPSQSVMMAWFLSAVILLAFMPSGGLTAVGLVVLSARYQAARPRPGGGTPG